MATKNGWWPILVIGLLLAAVAVVFVFPPQCRWSCPPGNKCMTQLHEIGVALQMYTDDCKRYPSSLAGSVQRNKDGSVIPFDSSDGEGLYRLGREVSSALPLPECPGRRL